MIFGNNEVSSQSIRTIFDRYSEIFPEKSAHGDFSEFVILLKEFFQSSKLPFNHDKNSPNDGPTSIDTSNFTEEPKVLHQHCNAVIQGIFHLPSFSFRSKISSV
ncbi:TPA: hypothetical protein DIC40_07290 [Patescibacteria group bacterium]|nr:hypothetical protein [Candidatus Gracilibacteria bacterium]